MKRLRDIIYRNRAGYCMECGKCSAVCPITRWETRAYASPRLLVETAVSGRMDELVGSPLFWSCLTCRRCSELCPSEVYFPDFIREARHLARENGECGPGTHGDVIHTWARIMTDPELRQNRLGWLEGDLQTSGDSDTVYFVGCLPHYDVLFREQGTEAVEIARSGLQILNALGISPQVLADERCCGHDQYWQGDMETFRSLAGLNLKLLSETGAKQIVTTCPECARTLSVDYPRRVGDHGMVVRHISQVVAASLREGRLKFTGAADGSRATFHDPCRLGRHLGIYEEPRSVLDALGFTLVEMTHTRSTAVCCGTSCWKACGQVNKSIQVERLKEAKLTGADLMVTACVKCHVHFACARQDRFLDEQTGIPIRDWTRLVAERLRNRAEDQSDTHAA